MKNKLFSMIVYPTVRKFLFAAVGERGYHRYSEISSTTTTPRVLCVVPSPLRITFTARKA